LYKNDTLTRVLFFYKFKNEQFVLQQTKSQGKTINRHVKMKNNEIQFKREGLGWKIIVAIWNLLKLSFMAAVVLVVVSIVHSVSTGFFGDGRMTQILSVFSAVLCILLSLDVWEENLLSKFRKLSDFVPGSYARLITCYFDGVQKWAIFCPADFSPSKKNIIHVAVTDVFWEKFSNVRNAIVRFVAIRGDMTEADKQVGVWSVAFDEVLEDQEPLRCKNETHAGSSLAPFSPLDDPPHQTVKPMPIPRNLPAEIVARSRGDVDPWDDDPMGLGFPVTAPKQE
jgi:hypothetical protein